MGNRSELYEIARDTAQIIHESSWELRGIEAVVLFGSALNDPKPSDIDLLFIIGSSDGWGVNYSPYPYGKLMFDEPPGKQNRRDPSGSVIHMAGYREGATEANSVYVKVGRRIAHLGLGKQFSQDDLEWAQRQGFPEFYLDMHGISKLFDAVVLSKEVFEKAELQREAVVSCRDPTFWFTILSKGMAYDPQTQDFTKRTGALYPTAVESFTFKELESSKKSNAYERAAGIIGEHVGDFADVFLRSYCAANSLTPEKFGWSDVSGLSRIIRPKNPYFGQLSPSAYIEMKRKLSSHERSIRPRRSRK
jgi:hypothetical protein